MVVVFGKEEGAKELGRRAWVVVVVVVVVVPSLLVLSLNANHLNSTQESCSSNAFALLVTLPRLFLKSRPTTRT